MSFKAFFQSALYIAIATSLYACGGGSENKTSVTTGGINIAPVASELTLETSEDVSIEGTLPATDEDGDELTFTIVTQPVNGSLAIAGGEATYTPEANFNGTDSFSFLVNDGASDSDVATVTLNVAAVNDAPVTSSVSASTTQDTAVEVTLSAMDIDGDNLTYEIVTQPSSGSLSTVNGNTVTYTPALNSSGEDSFTYRVSDGSSESGEATVTISVVAVNNAPVASALTVNTAEDSPVVVTLSATDSDGDSLTYEIVSPPTSGTLSALNDNKVTYIPASNSNGGDSFTYKASDGDTESVAITVNISVSAVNDAPVATALSATTNEDTAVEIILSATDPDGENLTYTIVGEPSQGTLSSISGNKVTYTPSANSNGDDSFTYKASDGESESAAATVSVSVSAVNDVPVVAAFSATTSEDTAVEITLSATDSDGDNLTYTIVGQPTQGTLSSISGNKVTYTPSANSTGDDSFTFKASDGDSESLAATVSVSVSAVNDVPVATALSATTNEDTAVEIILSATDPDGENLTYTIVGEPSQGTLSSIIGNKVTYTPSANSTGDDSFTYKASDGDSESAAATVSVSVTALNDVPVATALSATTSEDTAVEITLSATDLDGDDLTYTIVGQPNKGTLGSIIGNKVTYTPETNFNGTDSFSFKANDGISDSEVGTVSLSVNAVEDLTDISIQGGVMQKTPFELNVVEESGLSDLEWYLNGNLVTLPSTIENEGTYRLTGISTSANEMISTEISAISPQLVSSFEVSPNLEKSGYIYQDQNSLLSGVSLFFPSGAVAESTIIDAKESNIISIPNTDGIAISNVLTLEPSGMQFEKPVVVSLPYEGDIEPENIVVVSYSEGGIVDTSLPLSVNEETKIVTFSTTHFTEFVLQDAAFTFVDKPKSGQTEIQEIESLLETSYTSEEWEQILNEPLESTGETVYDLFLEHKKLDLMSSLIPNNYAEAVRVIFPDSSSALQEQIKTVESIIEAMDYVDQLSGLGFSPQGFTSIADKAEFVMSTVAAYSGVPTSVSDLTSVTQFHPHFVVNNLSSSFNEIDNFFYETLWDEFDAMLQLNDDESDFMTAGFLPGSDYLLDFMEDSIVEGVTLKAVLTPGMIHNLKRTYLTHKHFEENRAFLLENLKKIVAISYEAEKKSLSIKSKNHNSYYVNSEFIPSLLFEATGYGADGLKGSNPELTLSFGDETYSFDRDDFDSYTYATNGMLFDESSDVSVSQFVLSEKILVPNQAQNVQMTYVYSDDAGVEKEGVLYAKYISPLEASLESYKYEFRTYGGDFNKSISFTPIFENDDYQYVEYETHVTLGGRTEEGGRFVLSDAYYKALTNQGTASESDLEDLENLVITFIPKEGAKYTFDSKSFNLNLIDYWNLLEGEAHEADWSSISLSYPDYPTSVAVSVNDRIALWFASEHNLSENIEPLRADFDGNGVYDKTISNGTSLVRFQFPKAGIKGPSCIEFQHKVAKTIRKFCTPVRLTLEDGWVTGNTRPLAKDGEIAISEFEETEIELYGYDADGDDLIYTITSAPKNGSIISVDGSEVVYEPDRFSFYSDEEYFDSFTYVVNDGVTDSASKVMSLSKVSSIPPVLEEPEVTLSLSGVTSLEEGESTSITTGLDGEALRVECVTSTSAGAVNLADYGGSLSSNKTNVSITAPRYSEVTKFTLSCKASDSTNILAVDSVGINVIEKEEQPPEVLNEAPQVALPSNGTIPHNAVYEVEPSVSDDELSTVSYEWEVTWAGSNSATGTTSSVTANTLAVTVPEMVPGESGSVTVKLTVTDADGEKDDATSTYTYQQEKVESISFISEDFDDESTLERGSTHTLSWTLKNTGNVDLNNVRLFLNEKADSLEVEDISPALVSLWEKDTTQTFTVQLSVPNDVVSGTHKQLWKFTHNDGDPLSYESGNAASIYFEFSTTDPANLNARLVLNSASVEPNSTVYGAVEIYSGNAPYTIIADWGDGSDMMSYADISEDYSDGDTTYARQALQHSFDSEGEYNVTVEIIDAAGKSISPPLSNKITVTTSKASQWSVDVSDIDTSEHEEGIEFISESYTSDSGITAGRYSSSWSPSVIADSEEYFVKYRLPVPKDVLSLDKKLRVVASVKASNIAAHDREFAFRTQSGKEYTATMIDIDHDDDGYIRVRDLSANTVDLTRYPVLVDDYKDTKFANYSLVIEPSKFSFWREASDTNTSSELVSLNQDFLNESISELDLTFKGNGVIDVLVLQYDLNGDGEFSTTESLLLNTVSRSVDWSILLEEGSDSDEGILTIGDYDLETVLEGDSFSLESGHSEDPTISSFDWIINGWKLSNTPYFEFHNIEPGAYLVIHTVVNSQGVTSTYSKDFVVQANNVNEDVLSGSGILSSDDLEKLFDGDDVGFISGHQRESETLSFAWELNGETVGYSAELELINLEDGDYTVTHTVTDQEGISKIYSKSIMVQPNEPIIYNDLALLNCLNEHIEGGYTSSLKQSQLNTVTNLTCSLRDISDISVMSRMKNVEILQLQANNISNISPLSSLKNITHLSLQSNDISDLSPLSDLLSLESLNLASNLISNNNSDPISNLTSLRTVILNNNNISDVGFLADNIDLQYLSITNNEISDISILGSLSNIDTLGLSGNNIMDIHSLSNYDGSTLTLYSNCISDTSPLDGYSGRLIISNQRDDC